MSVQEYIEAHRARFMEEWTSLIRIPSISCQTEHKADMMRCAQRWKELLLEAGCQKAEFGDSAELIRLTLDGDYRTRLTNIYNKVEKHSVLIVESIRKNRSFWREIVADERTGVTFDLYYCGIVMFDKKRHKQNYIINF